MILGHAMTTLLAGLLAAAPAEEAAPAEQAPPVNYDPMRDSPQAIRARGWLRSGIVSTSAGVALGVVSIVLGMSDPCVPKGGDSCFEDARNRAALALGIPGAVLLTGGVAMLSVGVVRLKRLRAAVAVSHGHFTLSVGGRF